MVSSPAGPMAPGAAPGAAGAVVAGLVAASALVLAACLGISFRSAPGADFGTALVANGARVALGAGVGAAFALSGALRLEAGRVAPLGELLRFGLASAAAGGGFLAASGQTGAAAALAFGGGALAAAALAFALVRATDRPRRSSNLAAAGLLAAFIAVAALAGTYARARRDAVAPLVAWLTGDLSGATAYSAGAVLLLAAALLAAALRRAPGAGAPVALLAFGVGLGAAGPLAFVGVMAPRAVRALAPRAARGVLLAVCALAGAATVAALDAVPRWLVGGYALPWNVGAGFLAIPVFLGWNRMRLRRESGPASRVFEAAELALLVAMTGIASWLAVVLSSVIRAAT